MIPLSSFDVLVEDQGVDAARVELDGRAPVLVLRPGQTSESAVRAITRLVPRASHAEARALVREHLPHAVSLDELTRPTMPSEPPTHGRLPMLAVLVLVAVVLLLCLGFLVLHTHAYRGVDVDGYGKAPTTGYVAGA